MEAVPELGGDRVLDRQRVDVARRQRQYGREDAADDLEEAPLRVGVDPVPLRYFFDIPAWLRLASMSPKPRQEYRFPLYADARNQRGPFDEQELARVPD